MGRERGAHLAAMSGKSAWDMVRRDWRDQGQPCGLVFFQPAQPLRKRVEGPRWQQRGECDRVRLESCLCQRVQGAARHFVHFRVLACVQFSKQFAVQWRGTMGRFKKFAVATWSQKIQVVCFFNENMSLLSRFSMVYIQMRMSDSTNIPC